MRDLRPKVDIGGRAALHCAAVNRSIRPLLILVLLATSLAACSRCGSRPEAGSERTALARVPTDAAGALWIPDLGLFGERVAELQRLELLDFAAPMLRQPSGTALVDALVRQLGVDPRTREGLKAAGLEPGRDAAFASPVSGELLSVLPVSDAKVLEDNVRRLAQRLLAARAVTEVRVGEHRLLHFSRREGSPPVLGFAVVGNFALLLTEGLLGDAERVARLLSGSDEGMAANAVFSASRQRLGGKPLAWGYLAGGRGLLPQGTVEGVGAAFDLSLSGLSMRLDAPWPDDRTLLPALTVKQRSGKALGWLASDSFAVMRHAGDPAALGGLWTWLVGARATRAATEAGIDVEKDILGNLEPGIVAGLSLSPGARITSMTARQARRSNPFDWTELSLVATARDPKKAEATLQKVPQLAPRLGAKLTPDTREGVPVWLASWSAGEGTHLALVENHVAMASPEAELMELIRRLKEAPGTAPIAEDLAPLLTGHGLALVVDLHRLADAIRALPADAWGMGGFALKPTTVRWLDALKELRAVSLTADAKGQALQAELRLHLEVKKQ